MFVPELRLGDQGPAEGVEREPVQFVEQVHRPAMRPGGAERCGCADDPIGVAGHLPVGEQRRQEPTQHAVTLTFAKRDGLAKQVAEGRVLQLAFRDFASLVDEQCTCQFGRVDQHGRLPVAQVGPDVAAVTGDTCQELQVVPLDRGPLAITDRWGVPGHAQVQRSAEARHGAPVTAGSCTRRFL